MNKAVFFVTGASGFVGRHVCAQLLNDGFEVKAVVRSLDNSLQQAGAKLWVGDLWDEALVQEAMAGSTVIIHCAGDAQFGNGQHYYKANTDLTEHLIHIAKQSAQEQVRFVYISTIGAVDRARNDDCKEPLVEDSQPYPSSDYGKSKLEAEKAVRKSGLDYAIVRPTMVVGEDMRLDSHFAVFARQALQESWVARLAWPGCFSIIHVDDLSHAIIMVSTHQEAGGQSYFCAGEAIDITSFFRLCMPETKRLSLKYVSALLNPFRQWLPFSLKAMLLPALVASDQKLRCLGWSPKHSAESALQGVIMREKSRLDPSVSPGGQTVISGAASGLGLALAKKLAPQRGRLLLIDKDQDGLEQAAKIIGNCEIYATDLASEKGIDALLNSPEWKSYHITELYACAGIGLRGQMQNISMDNHRKMFAVNVLARIALAKNVIEAMQKRHFGRVVFISSSSAFQPLPYMATYAATNSALLSVGEAWGVEVAGDIQMMTVCPGGMQTNFQKSGGVKEVEGEKLMSPEEVAENIIQGLKNNKRTLIVSFRSFAMSMLARILSRNISVRLWGKLMEKMR